jgi:hypothetical protein
VLAFWLLSPLLPFTPSPQLLSWTGWISATILALFWVLPFLRILELHTSEEMVQIHKHLGLLILIPIAVHGYQYGTIWMLGIGILTLATLWVGQGQPKTSKPDSTPSNLSMQHWWQVHIILAFIITGIVFMHIWSVVAHS